MVREVLPYWLNAIGEMLVKSSIFPKLPNHVLINEYDGGQGILPHKDGPLYYPRVAILSLLGTVKLDFRKSPKAEPEMSLILKPRSLLVFDEDAYTSYFHGIDEVVLDEINEKVVNASESERGTVLNRTLRVSLTIRIVLNVLE